MSSRAAMPQAVVVLLFALLMGCAAPERPAEPTIAHVVNVHDGDTLMALYRGRNEKIRLAGIDCPEKDQPYGQEATDVTTSLALLKNVTIEEKGKDRYGRLLANVQLSDGRSLNQELVKAGACWWYQKAAPKDEELKRLESEAQSAHLGLWASASPVPPWEWRKQHRDRLQMTLRDRVLDLIE